MKKLIFLLAALGVVPTSAVASSHCVSSEATIFSCKVGKKTVSVCYLPATKDAQYRFGTLGKSLELKLPQVGDAPLVLGEANVFNGSYHQTIFSVSARRGQFSYEMSIAEMEASTLDVVSGGRVLSTLTCRSGTEQVNVDLFRKAAGESK